MFQLRQCFSLQTLITDFLFKYQMHFIIKTQIQFLLRRKNNNLVKQHFLLKIFNVPYILVTMSMF